VPIYGTYIQVTSNCKGRQMDSILKNQDVIFAHCLTQNGGAGNPFSNGKDLYQRISDTINNKPEISCSTIKSGDTLKYLKITNFFGPVGLILNNVKITFASPTDCGTSVLESGKRDYELTGETTPTEANILNAILNRPEKCYNELCSNSYNVFGFFLCFDDTQYLYQNIISETEFYEKTRQFNLPYFNLSKGVLFKAKYEPTQNCFVGNGQLLNSEIYG